MLRLYGKGGKTAGEARVFSIKNKAKFHQNRKIFFQLTIWLDNIKGDGIH